MSVTGFCSFFNRCRNASPQEKIDGDLMLANQVLKIREIASSLPTECLSYMESILNVGPVMWSAFLVPLYFNANPLVCFLAGASILTYNLIQTFRSNFFRLNFNQFHKNLDLFEDQLLSYPLETRNRAQALFTLAILEDQFEILPAHHQTDELRFRLDGLKDLITKSLKN